MEENIKKLDKGTIIRTIGLILALGNQIVAFLGQTSFASADWYQWVSYCLTAGMSIYAMWKNNDYTHAAKLGSTIMHDVKDGKITKEEVEDFIKNYSEDKE